MRTPLEHQAPTVTTVYRLGSRRVEVWQLDGERWAVLVEGEQFAGLVRLPRRAQSRSRSGIAR
jgi:hypothetical protein